MKIVCVTQRLIHDRTTNTLRDGLDKDLTIFLNKLGYLVIPIPNLKFTQNELDKILKTYVKKFKICGFVLSGGEDIGVNLNRDKIEKKIVRYCEKRKFPMIGICRGIQILAKLKKVKLVPIKNHVNKRHKIFRFNKIGQRTVNSFHNWGLKNCPNNFKITYVTKDKFIESIEHLRLPIKGVMWHPERERKYSNEDKKLFLETFK